MAINEIRNPIQRSQQALYGLSQGEQTLPLKVGDAFYEPAGVRVVKFNNDGDTPAKFVVFYLLGEDEKEMIRILEK